MHVNFVFSNHFIIETLNAITIDYNIYNENNTSITQYVNTMLK